MNARPTHLGLRHRPGAHRGVFAHAVSAGRAQRYSVRVFTLPWQRCRYLFYVDLLVNLAEERAQNALRHLQVGPRTTEQQLSHCLSGLAAGSHDSLVPPGLLDAGVTASTKRREVPLNPPRSNALCCSLAHSKHWHDCQHQDMRGTPLDLPRSNASRFSLALHTSLGAGSDAWHPPAHGLSRCS